MSFYSAVPICECGEKLVPIPDTFALSNPHAYISLGAPYGDFSPFYVRLSILKKLEIAQTALQKLGGWRIQIFDAYRPVAVQEFMVNYTRNELAKSLNLDANHPNYQIHEQELMEQVYKYWAIPSLDPATPPPHSTGAAVDVTLVDQNNCELDMGGLIDEISERSAPEYYQSATAPEQIKFHQTRELLKKCMIDAGFRQHPHEWWHFSWGDQMWCYLENQQNSDCESGFLQIARYGRI